MGSSIRNLNRQPLAFFAYRANFTTKDPELIAAFNPSLGQLQNQQVIGFRQYAFSLESHCFGHLIINLVS
jgi:hypothetical protein